MVLSLGVLPPPQIVRRVRWRRHYDHTLYADMKMEGAMTHKQKYVDLVITEANRDVKKRIKGDYRFCTLTRRGNHHFINLRLPKDVQETIISAYEQGKQVRIFA